MRAALLLIAVLAAGQSAPWQILTSGRDTNLRGISVTHASDKRGHVIWASGSNGIILRSTNDGETWKQIGVGGAPDLDFRDIEAVDANTAFVMSSGSGDKSRIYKTTDGGSIWTLQYSGTNPAIFLDALACESSSNCLALSDPVDGKFLLLSTRDGEHWKEITHDKMPAALASEGAFAASGTGLAICNHGENIYFGTGGASTARVFRSRDQGVSWTVANTPMAAGNASSGIFSIACDRAFVVATGGDYKSAAKAERVAAYSNDFGETWKLFENQPTGYRSAVAQMSKGMFFSVGPTGSDIAHVGDGKSLRWEHSSDTNLNAVSSDGSKVWAVGPKGTVALFVTP